MTKILPLKTLALALCAALVLGPDAAGAGPLLGLDTGIVKVSADTSALWGGQRWKQHRDDNDNNGDHNDHGNRGNNDGNGHWNGDGDHGRNDDNRGQWNGGPRGGNGGGGGGGQRDDRINRAIDIGRSRGEYIKAWPAGGSLFWVRVQTGQGRVDLLIDADSGRIVDQR